LEGIFATYVTNGLIAIIYKELSKIINKKTNSFEKKMGK